MTGPEDDFDPAVNAPDSVLGEEDAGEPNSFDEMADWDEADFEPEDDDDEEDEEEE